MNYTLVVVADVCDADFVTQVSKVTEEELPLIYKVVEAIKGYKQKPRVSGALYNSRGNYDLEFLSDDGSGNSCYAAALDYKGILTEEDIDQFNDYLGSMKAGYEVRTIHSIEIAPEVKREALFQKDR